MRLHTSAYDPTRHAELICRRGRFGLIALLLILWGIPVVWWAIGAWFIAIPCALLAALLTVPLLSTWRNRGRDENWTLAIAGQRIWINMRSADHQYDGARPSILSLDFSDVREAARYERKFNTPESDVGMTQHKRVYLELRLLRSVSDEVQEALDQPAPDKIWLDRWGIVDTSQGLRQEPAFTGVRIGRKAMDLSIVRRLLVTQLMGLALLGVSGAPLLAEARGSKNPIEVGIVDWGRDFEAALAASERSGKPVFAFFQEVPGCSGCKKFGADVMSHPSIVQAVQSEFIPVLIYNNRNGKDAALLKRFGEPSWNYQVIRFLNAAGKDLIPRKDKVWTTDALSARMVLALQAAGRDVPKYLQALADETATSRHRTAAFGQHCFWTGEFELGRIPGVISTEAGWLDGSEVTRLTYHADQLSLESLVAQAANTDSARKIYLESEAERQRVRQLGGIAVGKLDDSYRLARTSDQKRQIRQSVLYQLDLTPMQQTKVNALAPIDLQAALAWLTPDQLARFHELRAKQGR